MGIVQLTDHNRRTDFFQQTVRLNLDYWQGWLAETEETAVVALDGAQTAIVRAILFGLELGPPAWPETHPLIDRFSPFMERRGYWDTWDTVLRRAIESAQAAGDEARLVHLTALLARLLFQQSRFREARHSYRRTIRLARTIGDRFNEARACSNLGYHYAETGQWHRSEVLCCHALEIFEALDSNHGLAHTHNHLGILYIWQGQWNDAEYHLKQACNIWEEMSDQHGLMRGFINMGILYSNIELADKALSYYALAQKQAQILGDETEFYSIELNIGYVYNMVMMDKAALVEERTRQAEKFFLEREDQNHLLIAWNNLGYTCIRQGKLDEGYSYLELALDMVQRFKNIRRHIETLFSFVEYRLACDDESAAREHLQEIDDLLANEPGFKKFIQIHKLLERYWQRLGRTPNTNNA